MYDDYDDEIGYYDDLLDDIEEQEEEIDGIMKTAK